MTRMAVSGLGGPGLGMGDQEGRAGSVSPTRGGIKRGFGGAAGDGVAESR